VKTLFESPEMLAAAVITEPSISSKAPDATLGNPQEKAEPTVVQAAAGPRQRRESPPQRIAIRRIDRIIVLDPPSGATREYTLPESVRDKMILVHAVGNDQLLVQQWKHKSMYGDVELMWLQSDGSIAREASIALGGRPRRLAFRGFGRCPT
jgi:hypothetical protein